MIKTMTVAINCGEETCAAEPGKLCDLIRTTHYGRLFHCGLFDMEVLGEIDEWLQRCPECIARFVDKPD